jgi:hypothetical protein
LRVLVGALCGNDAINHQDELPPIAAAAVSAILGMAVGSLGPRGPRHPDFCRELVAALAEE